MEFKNFQVSAAFIVEFKPRSLESNLGDVKQFSEYFSHNGIKLGLFDDKRIICDGKEAISESKDGKENENIFFYFRLRFQNSKVQCNLHVRIDLIVF